MISWARVVAHIHHSGRRETQHDAGSGSDLVEPCRSNVANVRCMWLRSATAGVSSATGRHRWAVSFWATFLTMGDRDIRRFYADRVEPEELLSILSSHFGGAEGDRHGGVLFPSAKDFRVRLRVDNDGIADLELGRGLAESEANDLAREVREKLVENQSPVVVRGIVFCSIPVGGYFVAPEDAFHLIPAPPQAPRPPAFVGDHPLVIEFPVNSSSDSLIRTHRIGRDLARWIWFLNSVLLDHFATYSRSRQSWFLSVDRDVDPARPEVRWGQEGYFIPDWTPPTDDFTLPAGPAITIRSQDDYYARRGVSVNEMLTLPDSFETDVRRFLALGPASRSRFLQGGQWVTASRDLWGSHMSAWYIAQVAAIETLVHEDEPPDLCSECGRDKNQRPTARFKDFLERYAPGTGSRTEIDRLYSVRSGLVHGGTLLHHDSPFGSGMLAFATNEREPMDRLSRAVTIAMVNWLRANAVGA